MKQKFINPSKSCTCSHIVEPTNCENIDELDETMNHILKDLSRASSVSSQEIISKLVNDSSKNLIKVKL